MNKFEVLIVYQYEDLFSIYFVWSVITRPWGLPKWQFVVKSLPANAGDIRDIGQEDPLEEGMATHSSILA